MTGDYVVYRASTKVIGGVVAAMAVAVVVMLMRLAAQDVGVAVLVWVVVGWSALCGFLLTMVVRASTVVSGEGITVRQLYGTRHHPWAEIADIQIATVSGTRVLGAVIYDANLRRVFLPQVTGKALGPEHLDRVVGELRRRWAALRGPAWRPRTAEIAASRGRFWTSQRVGVVVGLAVGLTVAVLVAVL